MRVRVTLEPPQELCAIPINYNSCVSQFVYELLQPDTPFSRRVASTDPNEGILYYTFSNLYIPNVTQQGRFLEFCRVQIDLTISLLIDEQHEPEAMERIHEVDELFISEIQGEPVEHATELLQVKSVTKVEEVRSFGSRARFRMLSPLATPSEETPQGLRHVHFSSHDFSEALRETLLAKYRRWKGHDPKDTHFTFRLDQGYVQRRRGRISKLVTFNEMEENERKIKALVSPFEVEGNPELIWLGYVAGFGEKNILGFGCAEPLSASSKDVHASTVTHASLSSQ